MVILGCFALLVMLFRRKKRTLPYGCGNYPMIYQPTPYVPAIPNNGPRYAIRYQRPNRGNELVDIEDGRIHEIQDGYGVNGDGYGYDNEDYDQGAEAQQQQQEQHQQQELRQVKIGPVS